MRTVTRTYKVYSYDELSEVAKENVKKSFLEKCRKFVLFLSGNFYPMEICFEMERKSYDN